MKRYFIIFISGHCGAACFNGYERVNSLEEAIEFVERYNREREEGESEYCQYCGMALSLTWDRATYYTCSEEDCEKWSCYDCLKDIFTY